MKGLYLTIDDAPRKDFKKKIDFLISKKIEAVIFCTGELAERNKEALQYAIKMGFTLGNHGYNHPHFSSLTAGQAKEQIEKTDKIIDSVYDSIKENRLLKLFRFPYGDNGGMLAKSFQEILADLNYKQMDYKNVNPIYEKVFGKELDMMWTIDPQDWKMNPIGEEGGENQSFEKTIKNLKENGGLYLKDSNFTDIFLIHDHNGTSEKFPQVIEFLLQNEVIFLPPVHT